MRLERFRGRDGVELAYRDTGAGRPLVLLHGFMTTATAMWVEPGHADRLAAAGHRVLMPEMRGHGDSARPHDAASYPADFLADDGLAFLEHLGIEDYDLAGYSLGARTAVRMLTRGARPRRAVIAGTGMEGIVHGVGRGERYRSILAGFGTFEPGSFGARTEDSIRATGGDPLAMIHVLDSFVDTPIEAIAAIEVPVLVVIGEDDRDRPSAEDLASTMGAALEVIPGDHMRAPFSPDLTDAILRFLDSAGP